MLDVLKLPVRWTQKLFGEDAREEVHAGYKVAFDIFRGGERIAVEGGEDRDVARSRPTYISSLGQLLIHLLFGG